MLDDKKTKGHLRGALYAAIPMSFVAMVGGMIWLGQFTGGPVEDPDIVLETDPFDASSSPLNISTVSDPDGVGGDVMPTPSGPEGRDNRVFFE